MGQIVKFLEDITDGSPVGARLREEFYASPKAVMERGAYQLDEEDQLVICSVSKRRIWGYIGRRYSPAEAATAKQHLARLNRTALPPYRPYPDPNDLKADPWQGQACGHELPCVPYASLGEVDRAAEVAEAGAAWGAPSRHITWVIPGHASVGQEFRLVVSGSGLHPGDQIVFETHGQPGPFWIWDTDLFCERVFAATFIGVCITPTADMLDAGNAKVYGVKVRDGYGNLPDIASGASFEILP